MNNATTTFWGHADTATIQRAYDRLVDFYNRHNLPIDPSVVDDADGWNSQIALAVNRMLTDLWERSKHQSGGNVYRNGLAVFRRAVGDQRATGLFVGSGGTVQFSR